MPWGHSRCLHFYLSLSEQQQTCAAVRPNGSSPLFNSQSFPHLSLVCSISHGTCSPSTGSVCIRPSSHESSTRQPGFRRPVSPPPQGNKAALLLMLLVHVLVGVIGMQVAFASLSVVDENIIVSSPDLESDDAL